MTLHLLDLRPIKEFSSSDKKSMAVSIALMPDGSKQIVSRYGDLVWDFYPYLPQESMSTSRKRFDWGIALPDGHLLTDPEHAGLLESSKDFIWSLFANPVEGHKRSSMLTLISKGWLLIPLLRWMVSLGVMRFSDLAGRTLEYVPIAKLSEKGKPIASKTVSSRLLILEFLYHQRTKLKDALAIHPWPHEAAYSLAGMNGNGDSRKPKTELISDAVAGRLIEVAQDCVRHRSPKILAALEAVDIAVHAKETAGYGDTVITKTRNATARAAGFLGIVELRNEAIYLRTACYIIIDMFSGIRDSEMKSIAENCIVSGRSKDGSTEILWLHGTIYKTGIRPKRWMVPPVVKEAVDVLTLLTAPLRIELAQEEANILQRINHATYEERMQLVKRLDAVQKHKDKLFLSRSAGRGGAISVHGAPGNGDFKRFSTYFKILDMDGKPCLVHPHQFRRTYAHFMARSELGDLLTLRDHFGHWSIDMTLAYADGGADEYEADTELLEMITREKIERQAEVMGKFLNSDTPLANGADWLSDWRASVRTAANKEELIKEYAGTITLNGTGHSWCVGNARGMGCGGLCVFEAQMCVDCNYGIIGQEHRPVWQGIQEQQKEALALDDMGPGGRARALNILNYAEKVLHRLDGDEEL